MLQQLNNARTAAGAVSAIVFSLGSIYTVYTTNSFLHQLTPEKIIAGLSGLDNGKGGGLANRTLTVIESISIEGMGNSTAVAIQTVSGQVRKELITMQDQIMQVWAKNAVTIGIPIMLAYGIAATALPLFYTYVQKVLIHNIGKPPLALKQHKITWLNTFAPKINPFAKAPEVLAKPVFKPQVEEQIQSIVNATNNIKKNNAFFQNVILYGPGGTGKTMIAEKIAKEAGMNYIMMSGGELGQFIKRGEHVAELNRLMNAAEKSSNPTIIFIDEAEGLCKNRADLDQERLELQNTLLNRTGTPSKKIMIILATNRLQDIDKAILNRMAHKIKIDLPGLEERVQIIDMYTQQFFSDENERAEFFGQEAVQTMARKTENLSGRSLFYIINMIFAKKGGTSDNRLTQSIVDATVDEFVRQEKEVSELL